MRSHSLFRQPAHRATRRAVLLAAATVFLVLAAPLLAGLRYFGLDLTQIDLGNLCSTRQLLSEGASLWLSPHLGNGTPLLLRPGAQLLYPPRWLALALPVDLGASLYSIAHLTAAAAATAWLARSFGLRVVGAACAGAAFGLAGTTLDLLLHTSSFALGACYLPLVWAAGRRARHPRGGSAYLLAAGLGLAALLLGGEPQAFGVAAGLLCLEALRGVIKARRLPLRGEILLLLTIPASLATGAILWFGYWAEATLSFRAGGLELSEALMWSFDAELWPAALWPNAMARAALPHGNMNVWLLALRGPLGAHTWNASPYLGPLFLVALVCGLPLRRARLAMLVTAFGLLFALGGATPILPALMKAAPALAMFRFPAKYLVVTTLAAVVVVALSLERLGRDRRARRRMLLVGGVTLAGQALALLLVLLYAGELDEIWSALAGQSYYAGLPPLSQQLRWAVLQASVPLALVLVVQGLVPRLRKHLGVLLVCDLLLALPGQVQLGPALAARSSAVARAIRAEGVAAPVICVNWNALAYDLGGEESPGWRQMALRRLFLSSELQACDGFASAMPYASLWTSMNRLLVAGVWRDLAPASRALGCTHTVAAVEPGAGAAAASTGTGLHGPGTGGPRLFRTASPIPEFFTVRDPRLVASEHEVMDAVLQAHSAEAVVAIVDDPLRRLGESAPLPDGRGVTGISWSDPHTDRAKVIVNGTGGALVGLRTAFLVGWQARQGGAALPVLRVSGQHLAAVVDDVMRGPIQFRYRSPRFGVSVAVTLLGGVGLVAIAWLGRRRPKNADR